MNIKFISDKRMALFGDWSRVVSVDNQEYVVSVRRGRSVRIPYKPRGKNRGWQWHGAVYANGNCLWSGLVRGSIGWRGLLIEAGILPGILR